MFTFRKNWSSKAIRCLVCVCFVVNLILPSSGFAQALNLPAPGTLLAPTPVFHPAMMTGVEVHSDSPFQFDFIVNDGDDNLQGEALKKESEKMIKYFLASLTIPEKDLWVNLSPYEKDRIIPDALAQTDLGRDLLAQDYVLKQFTASMIHPENDLGKKFWDKVYKKAYETYQTTQIPVDTFNKVWIMPDKAVVYRYGNMAFVAEASLKVMLEEDYLALQKAQSSSLIADSKTNEPRAKSQELASQIVRDIVIPELEKEVNNGKHFAALRQAYNALILGTWFKKNLKDSLLGQAYVNKSKINGIDLTDKAVKQKIYDSYLTAYKQGAYNLIRAEYDAQAKRNVARKYFSGGIPLVEINLTQTNFPTSGQIETIVGKGGGNIKISSVLSNKKSRIKPRQRSTSPWERKKRYFIDEKGAKVWKQDRIRKYLLKKYNQSIDRKKAKITTGNAPLSPVEIISGNFRVVAVAPRGSYKELKNLTDQWVVYTFKSKKRISSGLAINQIINGSGETMLNDVWKTYAGRMIDKVVVYFSDGEQRDLEWAEWKSIESMWMEVDGSDDIIYVEIHFGGSSYVKVKSLNEDNTQWKVVEINHLPQRPARPAVVVKTSSNIKIPHLDAKLSVEEITAQINEALGYGNPEKTFVVRNVPHGNFFLEEYDPRAHKLEEIVSITLMYGDLKILITRDFSKNSWKISGVVDKNNQDVDFTQSPSPTNQTTPVLPTESAKIPYLSLTLTPEKVAAIIAEAVNKRPKGIFPMSLSPYKVLEIFSENKPLPVEIPGLWITFQDSSVMGVEMAGPRFVVVSYKDSFGAPIPFQQAKASPSVPSVLRDTEPKAQVISGPFEVSELSGKDVFAVVVFLSRKFKILPAQIRISSDQTRIGVQDGQLTYLVFREHEEWYLLTTTLDNSSEEFGTSTNADKKKEKARKQRGPRVSIPSIDFIRSKSSITFRETSFSGVIRGRVDLSGVEIGENVVIESDYPGEFRFREQAAPWFYVDRTGKMQELKSLHVYIRPDGKVYKESYEEWIRDSLGLSLRNRASKDSNPKFIRPGFSLTRDELLVLMGKDLDPEADGQIWSILGILSLVRSRKFSVNRFSSESMTKAYNGEDALKILSDLFGREVTFQDLYGKAKESLGSFDMAFKIAENVNRALESSPEYRGLDEPSWIRQVILKELAKNGFAPAVAVSAPEKISSGLKTYSRVLSEEKVARLISEEYAYNGWKTIKTDILVGKVVVYQRGLKNAQRTITAQKSGDWKVTTVVSSSIKEKAESFKLPGSFETPDVINTQVLNKIGRYIGNPIIITKLGGTFEGPSFRGSCTDIFTITYQYSEGKVTLTKPSSMRGDWVVKFTASSSATNARKSINEQGDALVTWPNLDLILRGNKDEDGRYKKFIVDTRLISLIKTDKRLLPILARYAKEVLSRDLPPEDALTSKDIIFSPNNGGVDRYRFTEDNFLYFMDALLRLDAFAARALVRDLAESTHSGIGEDDFVRFAKAQLQGLGLTDELIPRLNELKDKMMDVDKEMHGDLLRDKRTVIQDLLSWALAKPSENSFTVNFYRDLNKKDSRYSTKEFSFDRFVVLASEFMALGGVPAEFIRSLINLRETAVDDKKTKARKQAAQQVYDLLVKDPNSLQSACVLHPDPSRFAETLKEEHGDLFEEAITIDPEVFKDDWQMRAWQKEVEAKLRKISQGARDGNKAKIIVPVIVKGNISTESHKTFGNNLRAYTQQFTNIRFALILSVDKDYRIFAGMVKNESSEDSQFMWDLVTSLGLFDFSVSSAPTGGVDLTQLYKELNIKTDDQGVPLAVPFQDMESIYIDILRPIILEMTPINLPLQLGFDIPQEPAVAEVVKG